MATRKFHQLEMECGPKCRSKKHALQLINAITKGNTRQIELFLRKCHNFTHISDQFNRTVLQMASSCGNLDVVQWLVEEWATEIGSKDLESGWTALHRALFYGQLSIARLLISHGATQTRDKEGLTPLDIAMKDRLPHVEFVQSGLQEVYTWGDNSNYTLGHDSMQCKKYPEMIEEFSKVGASIKQVVMCKYHSVFLSTAGKVYTCGHGLGGRLGHGNENPCLVPTVVGAVQREHCTMIAASRDHTVMLMESGAIYSCGLNECQQLGHTPTSDKCLVPKQLTGKILKGKNVMGICAQRFHTVVYMLDAVYTFGLNAGQLGHPKVAGQKVISQPRLVSPLNHKDMNIKMAAASDAATVVVTVKGDVYALHEYQCRKIASKRLDIVQVTISGGHLDHNIHMEGLCEKGGSDLVILLLSVSGRVHIWRRSDPQLKRCTWVIRRTLSVTNVYVSVNKLAFVTTEGEAFVASLPSVKQNKDSTQSHKETTNSSLTPATDSFNVTVSDLVGAEAVEDIQVERLPMVHRATSITTDRKGYNFAVLQSQPNANLTDIPSVQSSEISQQFNCLLEEGNSLDLIHDVVLQVGSQQFAAHKFILASRSDFFQRLFTQKTEDMFIEDKCVIHIEHAHPLIFLQMLKFMYTDSCDLLRISSQFTLQEATVHLENGSEFIPVQGSSRKMAAYAAYQDQKRKSSGKKGGGKKKLGDDSQQLLGGANPVRLLQDMAKKYAVKGLSKKLEAVKWVNGSIQSVYGRTLAPQRLKFERSRFGMLYDVGIRSQDGVTVQCHKCVLVARLQYFHSMLASGWIETASTDALTLPVPGDILKVVLDYLYTDDTSSLASCDNPEFWCNVLVVADQLLIGRLKDMCEVAITSLISLKNGCELLQLASTYNAPQLKSTCQQFITINLPALLETRSLDVLSDEVLQELTAYYKDVVPGMGRRRITPYDGWPDHAYLDALETKYQEKDVDTGTERGNQPLLPQQHQLDKTAKTKRRRSRTKSTNEVSERKAVESLGSLKETQQSEPESPALVSCDVGSPDEVHISPREQVSTLDVMPRKRPSQPLTIPRKAEEAGPWGSWSSLSSPENAPDGPMLSAWSPSSPTSPQLQVAAVDTTVQTGLRDIMAQQSAVQFRQAGPALPAQQASRKPTKLSQKERKKQQAQRHITDDGQTTNVAKSPTTNPWGAVTGVVQSFKDLVLVEQEEQNSTVCQQASTSGGGARVSSPATANARTFSWGLPSGSTLAPGLSPVPVSDLDSADSPAQSNNPWQVSPPPGLSPRDRDRGGTAAAFTDIIEDELKQSETLQRATNKPLSLIQIEEHAMQELLVHYKAADLLDEVITVERVPTTLATPTWAATQRQ